MDNRRVQSVPLRVNKISFIGKIISFLTNFVFKDWYEFGTQGHLVWSSKTITAETRKIRAKWTPELAQDVSVFHSIDAELELQELLTGAINEQINTQIIGTFIGYNLTLIPKQSKSIAKKRRYKDRKLYVREIEEWAGIKINSDKIDAQL
jgi:hypothetical protein